jgi:hypothetical protein
MHLAIACVSNVQGTIEPLSHGSILLGSGDIATAGHGVPWPAIALSPYERGVGRDHVMYYWDQ